MYSEHCTLFIVFIVMRYKFKQFILTPVHNELMPAHFILHTEKSRLATVDCRQLTSFTLYALHHAPRKHYTCSTLFSQNVCSTHSSLPRPIDKSTLHTHIINCPHST